MAHQICQSAQSASMLGVLAHVASLPSERRKNVGPMLEGASLIDIFLCLESTRGYSCRWPCTCRPRDVIEEGDRRERPVACHPAALLYWTKYRSKYYRAIFIKMIMLKARAMFLAKEQNVTDLSDDAEAVKRAKHDVAKLMK